MNGAEVVYSKATVILNPFAGGRRELRTLPKIYEVLHRHVARIELVRTRAKGHGAHLARQAVENGSDLIVAVGGDGTVNEVVNGLFRGKEASGRDCALGIIPAGTSSSLAKELGIPRGLASAKLIAQGAARAIDLAALKWITPQGERKERLATTIAHFGFGGAVARSVGAGMRRFGGLLAFGAVATLQLLRYKSSRMIVEVDGKEIARSRIFCTIVANTQWEGGGMRVAPEARPDDGLLDVIVVEDLPLLSRLRHFPKVYTGKHIGLPVVRCARARRVVVRSTPPPAGLPFEFDGEWAECRECSIEVIPKALRVLVPKQSAQWDA